MPAALALLAASGPATPSMAPWPNSSPPCAGELALGDIGQERRGLRAAGRDRAEREAERGAPQPGRPGAPPVVAPMNGRPTGITSTGLRRRWAAVQAPRRWRRSRPRRPRCRCRPRARATPPVSRAWPVDRSSPTRPMVRPMKRPMKPRIFEEPSTLVTSTRESSMIAKYDGAPIFTACSAMRGMKNATAACRWCRR